MRLELADYLENPGAAMKPKVKQERLTELEVEP
jgi:hypothetical protein